MSDRTLVQQLGALFQASAHWLAGLGDEHDSAIAPAHRPTAPLPFSSHAIDAMVKNSPTAMVWLDARHHLTACNPAFERLLGYSQAEVLGRDINELIQTEISSTGLPISHTVSQRRRRDGALLEVEVVGVPLVHHGQVTGAVALYEDVTERRRMEAQLKLAQAALQAAANAILICDRNGLISWVNPAFTRLTGYTLEDVRGENMRLLKSGKHPLEYYQHLWQTILAGEVWHGQTINRRKDGTLYTEEQTIAPVCDDHGEITHFISIKQPLTPRQYIEAALAQQP